MSKKQYAFDMSGEGFPGFYKWNRGRFLIKSDDKRYKRFQEFKKKYGFSPDETWDLSWATTMFLLPRLKYFKEHACGYPARLDTAESWDKILEKIINALEIASADKPEELPKYKKLLKKEGLSAVNALLVKDSKEGFSLLGEYFCDLWW